MFRRLFIFIVLIGFCFCPLGCKSRNPNRREKEVILWVKKQPQAPEMAERLGIGAYDSYDEWVKDGRKIKNIEEILIGLIEKKPVHEILNPSDEFNLNINIIH